MFEKSFSNFWNFLELSRLCLETIPQRKFSFSKIWLMAAQFEIRQLNIDRARKILGSAIGKAPKNKVRHKLSRKKFTF